MAIDGWTRTELKLPIIANDCGIVANHPHELGANVGAQLQIRERSVTSLFQPEVTSNRGDRRCFLSKHTCSCFFDVSVSTVYKYVAGQRATPTRHTDFGQLTFRAMKESEVDNRTLPD